MASQDLLNAIKIHLEAGESPDKIKEYLVTEGWQEQAIDFAFEELKPKGPSFWQQLPTYPYFQHLDAKTAQLPAKVIWGISGLLIFVVAVLIFVIYLSMDPYLLGGPARDKEREEVYSQLQIALKRYYDQNNHYPATLTELAPSYIKYIPVDPRTRKPYDYSPNVNGTDYNICIYFENKSSSSGCHNTEVINAQQMGIPIPTEEPN